jgi:flagellar basal-body rod protein FlgC
MSLFNSLTISASGLSAQRIRAEYIVQNLANSETTRTAEGGPFRRKDVVFQSESQSGPFAAVFQNELQAQGVVASSVLEDGSEPEKRYLPGHPDADKNGYVAFPKINPAEEMADLMNASRSYQANVAAMSAVKDMIHRSIDLFR